jgi:hypothetical protein
MSSLKSVLCDFIGDCLDDYLDVLESADEDTKDPDEFWSDEELKVIRPQMEQLYDSLGGRRNEEGQRVRNR